MPDDKPRRIQTATDREMQSEKLRQERDRAERAAAAAAAFTPEEITGNYTGDELDAMRSRRPPDDRLHILESKHDRVAERLGKVETTVAGLAGEMKIIPSLVETMQDATRAMQTRETVKVTVEAEASKAQIELAKEKELASIESARVREQDALSERKSKRKRRNLYVAGAIGIASVAKHVIEFGVQAIHWLGSHL